MCESKFQVCPICYGDILYLLEIKEINKIVKICLECDSIWLNDEDTTPEASLPYSAFLQENNIKDIIINEDIYNNPVILNDID